MSDVWVITLAVFVFVCALFTLWAALRKRPEVSLWSIVAMMAAQTALQWSIGNHWVAYLSGAVAVAGTATLLYRRFAQ